jgi:hypothetical protein
LSRVGFEAEEASGIEVVPGCFDEGPYDVKAVPAAVQGKRWFPAHFPREAGEGVCRHIGGVGGDDMEAGGDVLEEVAFDEGNRE